MKQRFKATHRTNHTMIVGTFEDLSDLDKRQWYVRPIESDGSDSDRQVEPLAIVRIIKWSLWGLLTHCAYTLIEVWDHRDLVGLRLGGPS